MAITSITPFYSGRMAYDVLDSSGQRYVYVPQEFAQKGFVADGQQFFEPAFMQDGAFAKALPITLPSDSGLTSAAKSLYTKPTQGYIWKADDYSALNADDFSFSSYQISDTAPAITGIGKAGDKTVYATNAGAGQKSTYLSGSADGEVTFTNQAPSSGGKGGFFGMGGFLGNALGDAAGSITNAIDTLGPAGTLALNFAVPGLGTGLAAGSALGRGDITGAVVAAGLGELTGNSMFSDGSAVASAGALGADNIDAGGGFNPATGAGDAATANAAAATGVTASAAENYGATTVPGAEITGTPANAAATDYSITSGSQGQKYLANTGEGLTMSNVTGQAPNLEAMGGAQGLIAAEGSVLGDPTSFINNPAYIPADVAANPGTISEAGVTAANATPSLGDPASFVNGGTSGATGEAASAATSGATAAELAAAGLAGAGLVSVATPEMPAAPAYDGGVGAAALANVELGKDWLNFAKDQYAEGNKRQAATDALNTKVINQQLSTQDQANAWAKEDRSRTKSLFQPVEDAVVKTANEFDTPDRQDQASAQAKADVMANSAVQKQASTRQMASMGVSPISGRFASLNRATDTNTALAAASSQTNARNLIRDKGLALKADAVNIGKGLPSSTAAAYGIGLNAGNSAVANTASGNQNFNQNSNVMNTGFSGAIGANNSAGSMLGNLYGNQLNAWSAQKQANATSSAGLGNLVGTGIGAYAAL